MFIDINEIRHEGLSFDRPIALPDLSGPGEEKIVVTHATIAGEASRTERGVGLRARLEATVRLGCSRCTEPFEKPLAVEFYLTLVPDTGGSQSGEHRAEPEDATLFQVTGGKADLVAICCEQIYLNLPLKPICKEGCKGLCPHCGANRNSTDCGCAPEAIDPRLAPLLEFKKRQ